MRSNSQCSSPTQAYIHPALATAALIALSLLRNVPSLPSMHGTNGDTLRPREGMFKATKQSWAMPEEETGLVLSPTSS